MLGQAAVHLWTGKEATRNPSHVPFGIPLQRLISDCLKSSPKARPTPEQMLAEFVQLRDSCEKDGENAILRESSMRKSSKAPTSKKKLIEIETDQRSSSFNYGFSLRNLHETQDRDLKPEAELTPKSHAHMSFNTVGFERKAATAVVKQMRNRGMAKAFNTLRGHFGGFVHEETEQKLEEEVKEDVTDNVPEQVVSDSETPAETKLISDLTKQIAELRFQNQTTQLDALTAAPSIGGSGLALTSSLPGYMIDDPEERRFYGIATRSMRQKFEYERAAIHNQMLQQADPQWQAQQAHQKRLASLYYATIH